MTKMPILRIILTSAFAALAGGAGVYAIVTVAIRITDLKASHKKFRQWEDEQEEFEAW